MSHTSFPEGIELYRWIQANPADSAVEVVVRDIPSQSWATYVPLPDQKMTVTTVVITPMLCVYGWNEEYRVAVAFFGRPLPLFNRPEVSDDDVRSIIRTGRLGVQRKPLNLFRALLETWLSAMLDDEGEEWKRGRP